MPPTVPRDVLRKVRELRQLAEALRRGESFSVMRLTVLKSLCAETAIARRFTLYLARKALQRVEQRQRRSSGASPEKDRLHRQLMSGGIRELENWPDDPSQEQENKLWELWRRIKAEQNEHTAIPFGVMRWIDDSELLIVEKALRCVLSPRETSHLIYEMARTYAQRYDAHHPDGLVPVSAPFVQDIADLWADIEDDVVPAAKVTRSQEKPVKKSAAISQSGVGLRREKAGQASFTPRQGQFLAFIHLYRKLHRQGPEELDMVAYFRVTPPSVHGMVVKLEERGLITREPGVAGSARVTIPEDRLPALEEVTGPPW